MRLFPLVVANSARVSLMRMRRGPLCPVLANPGLAQGSAAPLGCIG
jgi:hypothetical protein